MYLLGSKATAANWHTWSVLGQNAKYSERADNFRFAPYERTSSSTNAMLEKCHLQTSRPRTLAANELAPRIRLFTDGPNVQFASGFPFKTVHSREPKREESCAIEPGQNGN